VTRSWLDRPEGGSAFALRFLVAIALGLGRDIARIVLLPVTAYFLVRRGPERSASRDYLTRALGRPPTLMEIARHFHVFAGVTLDRVYFLKGRLESFETRTIGIEKLHKAMAGGQGVLLLGAHAGSFDSLRALSLLRPDATVRVVLDAGHSPVLSKILTELNPGIAAGIINPRQSGVSVALEIGSALARGELVTMLADRGRPSHEVVEVDFLGDTARFPLAPWQLASVMHVPVVFCIGLYRGGNRYDLHFELLTRSLQVDRHRRSEQLQLAVQNFADRLAEHVRIAPYNWFNFYDFWGKD
jgi:predicted LPLAT superfamily acyltransferase